MDAPALLDVNVLVALFLPEHIHHEVAHDWFSDNRGLGWATCPITENGCVRVLSSLGLDAATTRPGAILTRLRKFCESGDHHFWPDAVSLRDPAVFDVAQIGGHRQLTDIYLLGVAVKMKGRLATFDRTIPRAGVIGAKAGSLAVIEAVA
jgi:uncharacterized protein